MKLLTRSLSLLTIASLVLFFANCGGGGEEESPKQKTQFAKLKKTWSIVTPNGADFEGDNRTASFANFKLTISGDYDADSPDGPYDFSVSGARPTPSPWPANGEWEFVLFQSSGNAGSLLRNDEVPMTYQINSAGQLILTVECAECNYTGAAAKTTNVNGTWTFTFN